MVTNFFEDGLDRRRESGVAIEIGGALEYISEKQHDRDAICWLLYDGDLVHGNKFQQKWMVVESSQLKVYLRYTPSGS